MINEEDTVINNNISSEESKEEDIVVKSKDNSQFRDEKIKIENTLKNEDTNETNNHEFKPLKNKDKKMKYEIPLYIDIKKTKK